jgi:hypothetical protein
MIEFTVEGDGLLASLRGKRDLLVTALTTRLNGLHLELQRRIQESVQGPILQQRSGKLVRSIEMIPATVTGDAIEGTVQAGGGMAPYAIYQELGTRGPYKIVPINKQALAFMIAGQSVVRRSVMHPGLQPRPFMSTGVEAMEPEIISGLQGAVDQVAAQ